MISKTPLAVDLDGTLILSDTLHESLVKLAREQLYRLVRLPFWLAKGKAHLKAMVARHAIPDAASLPYNEDFVEWLRGQRAAGRRLILCTAANERIAQAVAEHTQLFDDVLASTATRNLKGREKRRALDELTRDSGYAYAGNARADLDVWRGARSAVVVNAAPGLSAEAARLCPVEHVFPPSRASLPEVFRMLRVHQWAKNALLFVPAIASHTLSLDVFPTLLMAVLAFSLSASGVYVLNDLVDLENDRQHSRKRKRPFAAGTLAIPVGILSAPILLLAGVGLGFLVNTAFAGVLILYLLLTTAYSLKLKRIVLLDCLVLAGLYTVRVLAGAAAINLMPSFWLLTFSVFLFLSLAYVKRYIELLEVVSEHPDGTSLRGRGYTGADCDLVQSFGVGSGLVSVLVLALYVDSAASAELYAAPAFVWGAVGILLYWVSRVWLKAHRGEMHDDPVVYAVTDPGSLVCGLLFVGVVALGAVGLPWP